ncbi:hypothetical protein SmJEL517_g05684 [Synchytrium microbalum]|uniref:Basal body-orientation factor 1 n=1 Tax=Synchytrium microbalum TaxID=1806994 RepID=A0A507BJW2_9FUNG|nr:uncharacterized protein SmJEL517_g05684 [Synchytrium microbalum]TPX30840.1 hypothetical protein SmJEL517_g05684 [Synchytrium microbalum]
MPPKKAASKKAGGKDKKDGNKDKGQENIELNNSALVDGLHAPPSFREMELELQVQSLQNRIVAFQARFDDMVSENNELRRDGEVQERDTLDVLGALRAESEQKDVEIESLKHHIDAVRETCEVQIDSLKGECKKQVEEVLATMAEKDAQHNVILQEFATIKDFRRKRHELLAELDKSREDLVIIEARHADAMSRLERRFFEDKVRIQREANRKISDLAAQAHQEAVANLDETTRDVYRENVRLADALKRHVEDGEGLQKRNAELEARCKLLLDEREVNQMIVKEKILKSKSQGSEIKDLHTKVMSLESTLSTVILGFEREREALASRARIEIDTITATTDELRQDLKRRVKEAKHIKRLAQHVLDQRTSLEKFFMDALHYTRQQIRQSRAEAQREAKAQYQSQMRALVTSKEATSPALQSLKIIPPNSKKDLVQLILEEDPVTAPKPNQDGGVDLTDLSWSDKERVLRVLFAQMNGVSLTAPASDDNEQEDEREIEQVPEQKEAVAATDGAFARPKSESQAQAKRPSAASSRTPNLPQLRSLAETATSSFQSLGLDITGIPLGN